MLFLMWPAALAQAQVGADLSPYVISGTIDLAGIGQEEVRARMNRSWTYSFAQEPAARLTSTEKTSISGTAQFNYLSTILNGREETRGIISYRVTMTAEAGKCTYRITEIKHRGNTTTRMGGAHFGPLMSGNGPQNKVPGLGRGNVVRIHQDMKDQLKEHLSKVIGLLSLQLQLTP